MENHLAKELKDNAHCVSLFDICAKMNAKDKNEAYSNYIHISIHFSSITLISYKLEVLGYLTQHGSTKEHFIIRLR